MFLFTETVMKTNPWNELYVFISKFIDSVEYCWKLFGTVFQSTNRLPGWAKRV